jgi:2,5-diamino-6-(ribosylamino)-4(3H)-pyrimidinone 5'-phosphate reductase
LSTHLKDKVEKIEDVIAKLVDESSKGITIVVEGKKDAETLRELGVEGPVVTVKTGGKSFLGVASEIESSAPSEVILLLDFDRRGREGTKLLRQSLERVKIKVNIEIWLQLKSLTGHEMQCIESLFSYLRNLSQKIKSF